MTKLTITLHLPSTTCTCTCICMHSCVPAAYAHTCTHTRAPGRLRARLHACIPAWTHVCMHTHVHRQRDNCMLSCTPACLPACMHVRLHARLPAGQKSLCTSTASGEHRAGWAGCICVHARLRIQIRGISVTQSELCPPRSLPFTFYFYPFMIIKERCDDGICPADQADVNGSARCCRRVLPSWHSTGTQDARLGILHVTIRVLIHKFAVCL